MWPWHGLRWAVDGFSPFWEVGLFSSKIDSHLERVFSECVGRMVMRFW
jgi:hypothetical protein